MASPYVCRSCAASLRRQLRPRSTDTAIPKTLPFSRASRRFASTAATSQVNTARQIPKATPSRPSRRHASTATTSSPPPTSKPVAKLSDEQRAFLASALRVNHAGELAATLIYTSQTPPLVKAHPNLSPLMKHMYDQEAGHFKTFNHLLAKHRIRPSVLYPVWSAAASFLGWSTGLLGREAAMACTEAVETEIGEHYNSQIRELVKWGMEARERGEELDPELRELMGEVRRIRDEELEHLDEAVGEGAKEARPYEVLTGVVRGGCRGAIWVCERI